MWAMKIFWQMTQAIFFNLLQDILMFWASINMKYLYHILQMDMGNLREQIYIILPFCSHLFNYRMKGFVRQFRYLLAWYILILGTIIIHWATESPTQATTPLLEINKGKLKTDTEIGRWGATLILTILQSGQASWIRVFLFFSSVKMT